MAETPRPLSDPRYRAGVRLRRGGRFEAAANLLAEVLTLATEGAPDERQLDPTLAPLYYEYGVALVGVAREATAAEEDAEAAPSPKRRRLAGKAGGEEDADDDNDEENADDAAVAWQLVDQARCLFLEAGDRAAAARCAEQLAGLAVDQRKWADAVAEFSLGVEFYDAAADLDIEDRVHHLSCVAGLAAALGAHFAESPAADVAVNVDGDRATGLCYLVNYRHDSESGVAETPAPADVPKYVGEYHDVFVRTPEGWRFEDRYCTTAFLRPSRH